MKPTYFIELNEQEVKELRKVCEATNKGDNYFMIRMYARKYISKLDSLLEKKLQ
jgi:hypothetical protein